MITNHIFYHFFRFFSKILHAKRFFIKKGSQKFSDIISVSLSEKV